MVGPLTPEEINLVVGAGVGFWGVDRRQRVADQAGRGVIKIAISQAGLRRHRGDHEVGSVRYENATDEQGQRLDPVGAAGPQPSWRALRWPSESYSDVIIRMAASVIEVVQRGRDKALTKEEIYLSLEQARDLGQIDDSTGARLPLRAR